MYQGKAKMFFMVLLGLLLIGNIQAEDTTITGPLKLKEDEGKNKK